MAFAPRLRIGVAQLALEATLEANRDRIRGFVAAAASRGCRAVVFPEGALDSPEGTPKQAIAGAVEVVRDAAREHRIHVLLGLMDRRSDDEPLHNRRLVLDDRGPTLLAYDKLWADPRFHRIPEPFQVDGIPMAAAICADRWIRAVEELPVALGARVLVECSNNYAVEWVDDLGWYWQVPRARRNGVFVVLANTSRGSKSGHGHSAVIAPDGSLLAAAGTRLNSAYVLGQDGRLLNRYDQPRVDRPGLFAPGESTRAMWFELQGARGVVTLGADALWSELAELAGMAGAGLHLHFANDADTSPEAGLWRLQLWANLASFYTFTATVNAAAPAAGGSVLWHDFRPTTSHRREIDDRVMFSAHRLAAAGRDKAMLVARERLPPENLIHRAMTAVTAPAMRAWYDAGARAIVADAEPGETT